MKKIGLATAVLLAMTGAHAYQFELQGQSEHLDVNGYDKSYTGQGQGTVYFKDVDASKGPLAEAAFLNKASNVQLGYHYNKLEADNGGPHTQTQAYGAKAEGYYTLPALPAVPMYGSASYSHTQWKNKSTNYKDNGDRYALEIGAMPADNFLVAVGYTSVANPYALDNFKAFNNGVITAQNEASVSNLRKDAFTARAKYVGNIDNTNMAFGFEVDSVFADSKAAYGLATDLYLTPKLSVGATFADTSSYNSGYDHIWGGNVNYFITPAVSLGATYTKANAQSYRDSTAQAADAETIGLNARVRF